MAAKYEDGVVLGADSRSVKGAYVDCYVRWSTISVEVCSFDASGLITPP